MKPDKETLRHSSDTPESMPRRSFLKTTGGALGLATMTALGGMDALRRVEAAVGDIATLSPQQAAMEESFWREIQQAFSVTRSVINLNNAWTCPSPRIVTEAVVRYIWQREDGPAVSMRDVLAPRKEKVRISLARQFGVSPEEIAVVRNATEALQNVLVGFPLNPGDEILATDLEYNSMMYGLERRKERDGVVIKQVEVPKPPESPDAWVRAVEQGITSKTRLILVSHIETSFGGIFPIRAICDIAHQRGVEVVVDGAHSFAHLDFKHADLDCDYFGTSLHKWLGAPKSTGMLFVRKDKIEKLWSLYPSSSRVKQRIEKFERYGVQSLAPFLGIEEALAFHNGIGPRRKEERLRYLTHYWAERLQKIPTVQMNTSLDSRLSCGIANFTVNGMNIRGLGNYLNEEHHILNATGGREGVRGLRISPNVYTTLDELNYFCDVIEDAVKNGLPEPYKSYQPPGFGGQPQG